MRLLLLLLAAAACIAATSRHAPKAVSTDGEATIYLLGDFRRGFNVAYNAVLPQERTNHGTTFVDVMLLGPRNPGGSVALGLTRSPPNQSLQAFVATTTAHGADHYGSFPVVCLPACSLILRGDRYGLYAFALTADGIRKLGSWARADLAIVRPYVQLNAEVATPGDRIGATLIPMRLVADSHDLAPPKCAFTTRGVMPRRDPGGMLHFTGAFRPEATAAFVDLKKADFVDRCS